MARTRLAGPRYVILEWRDRCYRHLRDFYGDATAAAREVARLNEGYSGPRYIYKDINEFARR